MYRSRFYVLMGLLFLPALLVLVRLFELQIVRGAEYRDAQERKVRRVEVLPALRGRILDRNGSPLALDEMQFDLRLILAEVTNAESLLRGIGDVSGIAYNRLQERFELLVKTVNERASYAVVREEGERKVVARSDRDRRRALRAEMRIPYELARGLTFEEMSRIVTRPDIFSGIVVSERSKRRYPEGKTAAHVVGYVGPLQRPAKEGEPGEYERLERAGYFRASFAEDIPDSDYESLEELGSFRADVLGRAGVEKAFESALAGKRGFLIVERDIRTRTETEIFKSPPVPGADVRLTIDMPLQNHVESVLATIPKSAVAIVLGVEDGEILALVSSPTYEPGKLQSPVSPETVRSVLQDNLGRPLMNRAISEQYMLGSVFKIVTTIAALETQTITPTTEIECRGRFREDVQGFRCWIGAPDIGGSHGPLSLKMAMAVSCNVFFVETGDHMKGKALAAWAGRLGFGERTGVELLGEVPGILPTPSRPIVGRYWSDVDTWNLSIGQGALAVTPLQVAQLMATVSRQCDESSSVPLARPHVVAEVFQHQVGPAPSGGEAPQSAGSRALPRTLHISKGTLAALRAGLFAVVNDSQGTAHRSGLAAFGNVAGKTSTAEISKSGTPAPHAWFAGYYPADSPKYAFVVLVVNGGKGSETAAPLAARIVEYLRTIR